MNRDEFILGVIGSYHILAALGHGGSGSVYKARDPQGRIVALKVLSEELSHEGEHLRRFMHEAAMLSEVFHPNVVHYYHADYDEGRFYYAMEYVDGVCVGDLLDDKAVFSESEIVDIALQAASAVEYAGRLGIVHRDIKPDNIMLEKATGNVKILDLGLAASVSEGIKRITRGFRAIGTVWYMSPEQAEGERAVDIRTDIYGLGATLYHMLTGRPPHKGANDFESLQNVVSEPAVDARELNPTASVDLSRVIMRMIAHDPADRYASAAELIADLTRLREGLPWDEEHLHVLAAVTGPASVPAGLPGHAGLLYGLTVLAVLLIMAVIYLMWFS